MKRKLESSLNFFLIIMIVSTLLVTMNTNIDRGISRNNENSFQAEVEQNNVDLLNFFDITDFTNTSHEIRVSRVITANPYGYTTSYTKIHLYLSENASQQIDAFNYTIPSHELLDTKYLEIFSLNDTKADPTVVLDTIEENESTTFVIKTPSVGKNQILSIIIKMDHPNAITFEENAKLDDSTYPYQFNLSFLPLISFPITSYNLQWKVGKDIEVKMENDSIQPTSDYFTGNFSEDTSYGLVFENITELSTINRSLLNKSEYGNYNLTALQNRPFIPAYIPTLANNLSSNLSFNYFQQANTIIEFTELKSVVTVSEWGYVNTEYRITIHNIGIKSGSTLSTALGGSIFPQIAFYLPETAKKISLRDNYGNLTPAVSIDSILSKKLLEIKPRVLIEQNAKYDLFLTYREQVSDLVKDVGGGKTQLRIPLSLNINWTIQRFEFNLLLPHGSSYNMTGITSSIEQKVLRDSIHNSSIRKRELLGIFHKTGFKIIFEDLTPLSNQYLNLDFGLPFLYLINTPLSICILFLLLGIAYTIVRNLSFGFKPKKITIEEIPLDLIKEFVKAYEEKTAIREQILSLDRKRKSKKIKQREYEQTRLILGNRQKGIDRSIVTVSKKIAEEGPRYRISMRSIEVAEANREDILQNIESLERKKTQGRIGKEAYAKLKVNYDKQLRKANNEVDKVLIDLRSLLTE
ncbi:MAG: hypothetical protein JSU57_02520 [Candidatus Heimdallarchaeota archaeon]|nr:MAG: hypothetical protein JSU57_02520 [Candidatus Heimdallarchaeota archaeon]